MADAPSRHLSGRHGVGQRDAAGARPQQLGLVLDEAPLQGARRRRAQAQEPLRVGPRALAAPTALRATAAAAAAAARSSGSGSGSGSSTTTSSSSSSKAKMRVIVK